MLSISWLNAYSSILFGYGVPIPDALVSRAIIVVRLNRDLALHRAVCRP